MIIEKKVWDSEFFGYPVGQINLSGQETEMEKIIAEAKKYRLVYLFSEYKIGFYDTSLKHVDTKIIWAKNIISNKGNVDREEFNYLIHSYDELLYLAYLSGTYSRFRIDDDFKDNEFEKLYKLWIEKSVKGEYDNKVFVKSNKRNLEGLITLNNNNDRTAQVGLIAVHPKAQGKGIATYLIQVAANYAFDNGFKTLEIATQFKNTPAMKLYEKNGFYIDSKEYIYHIWNK